MKRIALPVLLVLLGFLSACVTINVYFPAAAAEKAADRIIDQVYGTDAEPAPPSGDESPQSSMPFMQPLAWLLEQLVPAAHAAPNFDVQTPAIAGITADMEARHAQLAPFYTSGGVGMTNNGEVTIRDLAAIPLRDRGRVKQLIAAENQDRNALYREIARANGHPEWEGEIRATFARRWVARAPAGWWYQDAGGGWKQK